MGYLTVPNTNINTSSFLCSNQLSQPNFNGGSFIDGSNILYSGSNIVMDSSHYVRVPTPIISTDCVNKLYSDSNNSTKNLNQFMIQISNSGSYISLTSTVYPAGTYNLGLNPVSFSSTLQSQYPVTSAISSVSLLSATGTLNGYRFVITINFTIANMPTNITNYKVFVNSEDTITGNSLGTQASTDDAVPVYTSGWGTATATNQPLYISIYKGGIANSNVKINLLFMNMNI